MGKYVYFQIFTLTHLSANIIFKNRYVTRYFWGVHANLSKCWRGTWSEKDWEPLL